MIKFTVDILPNDLLAVKGHYLGSLFHHVCKSFDIRYKILFSLFGGRFGVFYLPFFIVDFRVILSISTGINRDYLFFIIQGPFHLLQNLEFVCNCDFLVI